MLGCSQKCCTQLHGRFQTHAQGHGQVVWVGLAQGANGGNDASVVNEGGTLKLRGRLR